MSEPSDTQDPRIECSLRAFALCDDGADWLVRLDLPRELDRIDAEGFDQVLASVADTLVGLRGLNQHTKREPPAPGELQLVIRCGIRASRTDRDPWKCGVIFTWPPEWSELGRDARDAVFEAMIAAFAELRAAPRRPRMRGWET